MKKLWNGCWEILSLPYMSVFIDLERLDFRICLSLSYGLSIGLGILHIDFVWFESSLERNVQDERCPKN